VSLVNSPHLPSKNNAKKTKKSFDISQSLCDDVFKLREGTRQSSPLASKVIKGLETLSVYPLEHGKKDLIL
jgi:hypothetical protein